MNWSEWRLVCLVVDGYWLQLGIFRVNYMSQVDGQRRTGCRIEMDTSMANAPTTWEVEI